MKESLSTIKVPWKDQEKILRASNRASTLASLGSLTPTPFESIHKTKPFSSRYTPPLPAGLGLPLAAPLTLNFNALECRGDHYKTTFLFLGPQSKHASQLNKMSFEVMLANSFLAEAHLAILENTT